MSEISLAKAQFATELESAGLKVLDYIPARITPPIVLINAASPYLTTAEFGEYYLNLELVLVAKTASNEQATTALDQLIEDVVVAVENLAWVSIRKENSVGQPYALQVNNAEYLSANIFVQLAITL